MDLSDRSSVMETESKPKPKVDYSFVLPAKKPVPCPSCGDSKPQKKLEDQPAVGTHD